MRVLVTGAKGQVGSEVLAALALHGASLRRGPKLEVVGASHGELDVADREAVFAAVRTIEPDLIIHTAAFTAVDRCEDEVDLAFSVNALGTRFVQEAARQVRAHVTYLSTDYVFDGTAQRAYCEWDEPCPTSVYGRSKLGGEHELDHDSTIVRTAGVCGVVGANIAKTVLSLARRDSQPLRFVDDQHCSPTMAADLAQVVVELSLERRSGIFHVTNEGATSWYGFAQAVLEFAGEDPKRVLPIATSELDPPLRAPRPANSVLDNAALRLCGKAPLAPWRDALGVLVGELTT